MPDVLHLICTRLGPGHLSERVGDSSQGSEDIVKKKKSQIVPFNAVIIVIINDEQESEKKTGALTFSQARCTHISPTATALVLEQFTAKMYMHLRRLNAEQGPESWRPTTVK